MRGGRREKGGIRQMTGCRHKAVFDCIAFSFSLFVTQILDFMWIYEKKDHKEHAALTNFSNCACGCLVVYSKNPDLNCIFIYI